MYQAENITWKLHHPVIFSGKKMYRINLRSSKNGVLLKSVIPVMPAHFLHKYPPGMSTFVSYVYLVTFVHTALLFSLSICIRC
jgi:hypothetical protein